MAIKKGDVVQVISGGPKVKGLVGKVVSIDHKQCRVVLENAPSHKRHMKPQRHPKHPEGGIISVPMSVHISNVMLRSESLGRPVRTGYSIGADKKKVRVCRGKGTTGEVI